MGESLAENPAQTSHLGKKHQRNLAEAKVVEYIAMHCMVFLHGPVWQLRWFPRLFPLYPLELAIHF